MVVCGVSAGGVLGGLSSSHSVGKDQAGGRGVDVEQNSTSEKTGSYVSARDDSLSQVIASDLTSRIVMGMKGAKERAVSSPVERSIAAQNQILGQFANRKRAVASETRDHHRAPGVVSTDHKLTTFLSQNFATKISSKNSSSRSPSSRRVSKSPQHNSLAPRESKSKEEGKEEQLEDAEDFLRSNVFTAEDYKRLTRTKMREAAA